MTHTLRYAILVLVLTAGVHAEARRLVYRLPGGPDIEAALAPFLEEWPYVAGCGVDEATWRTWRGSLDAMRFDKVRTIPNVETAVTVVTELPAATVDGILRAVFVRWRDRRVGALRAEAGRLAAARAGIERRIAALREETRALAGRNDIAFDRARAIDRAEDRAAELADRLADAHIDRGVARARAQAVERILKKRESEWEKRQEHWLDVLRERLRTLRTQYDAGHLAVLRIEERIEVIEFEENVDKLSADLASQLANLEIELVGFDELIDQLQDALRANRKRRADLLAARDLRSVAARIEHLELEAAGLDDAALLGRIDQLRKAMPQREALPR